jgi:transposase
MNLHLAEISRSVAARAHAVLMLDGAGWHSAHDLVVPGNITLLPLPPCAPELNPVENVWQFIRDNWLGDRIFTSRRHRRPLLPRLEQAHRPALEDHVPRTAPLGLPVMINADWY